MIATRVGGSGPRERRAGPIAAAGRALRDPLRAALVGYVVVVSVLYLAAVSPVPFASTPDGVIDGQLWQLLASGLVIATADRTAAIESIVLLVLVLAAALRVASPRRVVTVALTAHVASTLVAYAALGIARTAGWEVGSDAVTTPDYGISCVVAGWLGLVTVAARPALLRIALLSLALWQFPFGGDLTGFEHALAFITGLLLAPPTNDSPFGRQLAWRHRPPRHRLGGGTQIRTVAVAATIILMIAGSIPSSDATRDVGQVVARHPAIAHLTIRGPHITPFAHPNGPRQHNPGAS
jgi:hypothetical protein